MSLNPPDYAPNPHVAYCKIWINGTEITTIGERPQRLMGFSYAMIGNTGGNRVNFTLFDEKWVELEQLLATANDMMVDFQFGYTTGRMSEKYTAKIFSYKPTFLINGMQLLLEGISPGFAETNKDKKSQDRQQPRNFPGCMGKDEADIHEIVEFIAKENDWDTDIEECEPVYNNDDLNKSGKVKMHFTQPAGQRDIQFIMEQLSPWAQSKKNKDTDYKVFFEDPKNGSKSKLHFHPPKLKNLGKDTYVFMQDKMSEVIQFTPEIVDAINLKLGGGVSGANVIDQQTGEYESIFSCNTNTPEKTILGGQFVAASDPDKEKYSTTIIEPWRDKTMAYISTRNRYQQMFNSRIAGELIILGNPKLQLHETCQVYVVLPDGKFHYTSGIYYKMSCVHELNGGRFTTTIALIRSGHEKIQSAVGVGEVISMEVGPPAPAE